MWQTISKFGLNHCDLPTLIWNLSVLLRTLALNIHPEYNGKIPILSYVFTVVIWTCYFYVYFFSGIWFVFWKCRETGDIITAMIIFSVCIASEISTVKFIYMFAYQISLRNMIKKYLVFDSTAIFNNRLKKNQLIVLRQVKKRAMMFWITLITNGFIYAVKPLVLPGRHAIEDADYIYGLEPLLESPNYEIGYFLTVPGIIFTCYVPANVSGFFIIITGYIEAQMTALSEELTLIWDDAQQHYNTLLKDKTAIENNEDIHKEKVLNEYIKKQLHVIIKMHAVNISFYQQIEMVFRGAMALEFGILTAGLIAEFLGGIENTYIDMPYALMQVGMDCITGQKLIDASLAFEQAVYDSKWENFDLPNKKIIMMILLNAQKHMCLTAGGFTNLSYVCLMTVMRMIYSVYTTLSSVMTG